MLKSHIGFALPAGESMEIDHPRCGGCRAPSPPTNSNYTLISQKHGWRLVLKEDESGNRVGQWSCPACWTKKRDARKQVR
jgi:hypothetical protein